MSDKELPLARGRGSQTNAPNRFTRIAYEDDLEHLEYDKETREARRSIRSEYFTDDARSVISENDSPDIPIRYSLNVYRGCSHGCRYCFARPTHEYLGLVFARRLGLGRRGGSLDTSQFRRPTPSSGQGWLFP